MSSIIKGVDCPDEKHEAGEVIFKEGTLSNCFYIIKSGSIDVYKNHGKADQFKLATIPAGRVLGEISCLDDGPRSATAVAQTDVHLVRVPAETLKWQLKHCPRWFSAVVLDLVERLRSTDDLLSSTKSSPHLNGMTSMKDTHSE